MGSPVPLPQGVAPPSPLGLVSFFLLGALGSVHCLGMCGPLAVSYADSASGSHSRQRRLQVLFNGGRTVGYAAVGGALGAASGFVIGIAGLASLGGIVRGAVGLAAGLLILAVGISYLRRGTPRLKFVGFDAPFRHVSGRFLARIRGLADGPGIVGLGVGHALLPCPLLLPAYAYAFSTGSALVGASALAALGIGTVPAMFLAGAGGERLLNHGPLAQRALGGLFVVLGVLPLSHGLAALGGV